MHAVGYQLHAGKHKFVLAQQFQPLSTQIHALVVASAQELLDYFVLGT